ncbi:hypothetical protein J4475_01150 [Candidatus Woesearchaeota archaeon]|nr:hypothetical protein [Candidatus Woesearchaeota archaeon]
MAELAIIPAEAVRDNYELITLLGLAGILIIFWLLVRHHKKTRRVKSAKR